MSKLASIVKFLTMNRATFLGYSMLTGGLAGLATGIIKNDAETTFYSAMSMMFSFCFLAPTNCGRQTYTTYKKTKERIQKHKKLDERVVEINRRLYCNRQGVYMAAKELGCLDDYKKVMKGKFRIIPNF